MSESLRECETESIENGDHVRRGRWKCGKCPEPPMSWESRVPARVIESCESLADIDRLVTDEHRETRRIVAGSIERHLNTHDDT